jgi:outer membrane protein TolC
MGRILALLLLLVPPIAMGQDVQPPEGQTTSPEGQTTSEEAVVPSDSTPAEEIEAGEVFDPNRVFDTVQMDRIEQLAREGLLPGYEDLRLSPLNAVEVREAFILSLPVLTGELADENIVFPEVAAESPFSLLSLDELVDLALAGNFDLINSRRGVDIARSNVVGAEAFFLPFVDLVGNARISEGEERDLLVQPPFTPAPTPDPMDPDPPPAPTPPPPEVVRRRTTNDRVEAGTELRQNLATGGTITGRAVQSRDRTRARDPFTTEDNDFYDSDAEVRILQPLLRGSGLLTGEGTAVGTASLRSSRLSEMSTILTDRIRQRDTVLQVIQQYFQILQAKQNILISRDAIQTRFRFLDETRVKFEVGRVAESEILRAQIQFLQEIETAISRIQALDDARENLLLTLGLPLDTPISLVDITPQLRARGRFELPPVEGAVALAINNRWELMQSDINIAQAEIDRLLARVDRLPELDVDGGYRTYDTGPRYDDANDWNNDIFDAGVSLRIPLQNIQRREAHRQSIIRVEQEATNRLALERDIIQAVLSAHRAVLTNEARLTVSQQRVEQARRNLQLITDSFEVGFSTVTEVRLAQDDLFDAETSYSTAVLSYQTNIARLYQTVGLPLY